MVARTDGNKGKELKNELARSDLTISRAIAPSRRGSLASYGAFTPFHRLRQEFNRLFDQLLPGWAGPWMEEVGQHWGLDVSEDDEHVNICAEAPGFEPADFDIQVRGNQLIMRATHKRETEEKERGLHEWRQQDFYRSVPLMDDVDKDKVDATYRNGILKVALVKTEQAKGRHIEVKG